MFKGGCAHISVNRQHASHLHCTGIKHWQISVVAVNAMTFSLFQAESAEEEQGCIFFMMSARDSLNLHLCPICAQASVQSFALNQH